MTVPPSIHRDRTSAIGYSEAFDRALILAAIVHRRQLRKGTGIPYLIHPVHVARILDEHGYPVEVVIAGLLHDVLEDADWDDAELQRALTAAFPELAAAVQPTDLPAAVEELIRRQFGEQVLQLVRAVTEQKSEGGVKRPWRLRKEEQLAHLDTMPAEAIALKAADALHNVRSLVRDLRRDGPAAWTRFNAPPDEQIWYVTALAEKIRQRSETANPLAAELWQVADECSRLAGRRLTLADRETGSASS